MKHQQRSRLSLVMGLSLLLGLLAVAGGVGHSAHAATTLTVTNCSNDTQLQADVSTANSDNAGDTIKFACSGDILLTSTLTISGSMTLDGSGLTVTLDGQFQRRVLSVSGSVSLTLKALSIANGFVSDDAGGGLFNNGTLSISNSTFSGNSVGSFPSSGFGGGGIENHGTLSISNSTFSDNPALAGGGIYTSRAVNIGGSIVADNTGGDCYSPLTDQGYNLSSDSSCGFTGTGSLQNTDPKLDPNGLLNNGGPTQTIALEPDGPAVDHIPVGSSCPASGATDQRGVSRPQGPACDIGAFEMTAADGLTVLIHVVNSFHLAKGLQSSLNSQLHAVLADLQANNTAKACTDLTSFINHVKAQSGKGLTTAQAAQLLTEAAVIKTRLGC